MNIFYFLQMTLPRLTILALAALVSAGGLTQPRVCRCNSALTAHCKINNNSLIPYGETENCETNNNSSLVSHSVDKDIRRYVMIPVYVMVIGVFFVIVPWLLWRIIRNKSSWKIHTRSPRPQYIRTSFRWVDVMTWKQKQAEQARRKEVKRDQHPIYRTTKANYNWIFHDPSGELQQRFNQQKERSHLRFLPSWMRSYPHGTMWSGIPAQQSEALNESYQVPKPNVNENSCLSNREYFGSLQIDGSPMSDALPDPYYQLPNLSKMDGHVAMTPNTSGKARSLPIFAVMDEPDVIQVWFIRDHVEMPERRDYPRLEHEEELRGEMESAEEVMRRDTEQRLEIGAYDFRVISPYLVSNP